MSGPEAYPLALVSQVTKLSPRQLQELDELGVVRPSIAPWDPFSPPLYSFTDMIRAEVARQMWERDLPPTRIVKLLAELDARGYDDPLLTVRFVVDHDESAEPGSKGRVFVLDERDQLVSGRHIDQHAETYDLHMLELKSGIKGTLADLKRREVGSVEQVRGVHGHQAVVGGTRVPTAQLAAMRRDGWSVARILQAFPHLEPADVEAAVAYEAELKSA